MNKRVFEVSSSKRKEKRFEENQHVISEWRGGPSRLAERIDRRFSVWPMHIFHSGPETTQFIVTFKEKISVDEFIHRLERAFKC